MYKKAELLVMRAITPVHAGSGSDLGLVDLPIQRENHTNYPKFESSGLKGCIRQTIENIASSETDVYNIHNLFGYDQNSLNCYVDSENGIVDISKDVNKAFEDSSEFAGCVGFTDGKILLFPMPSAKGVFAYVTCPSVLERLTKEADFSDIKIPEIPKRLQSNSALCTDKCELILNKRGSGKKIVIEEYTYTASENEAVTKLSDLLASLSGIDADILSSKLLIVADDDFRDFVTMHTEVITRTKINNATGTVEPGALFTEEYLPVETVMYASVLFSVSFAAVLKTPSKDKYYTVEKVKSIFAELKKDTSVIQIGGGSSIGKGIMQITFSRG